MKKRTATEVTVPCAAKSARAEIETLFSSYV
jgi:hypothetical protein